LLATADLGPAPPRGAALLVEDLEVVGEAFAEGRGCVARRDEEPLFYRNRIGGAGAREGGCVHVRVRVRGPVVAVLFAVVAPIIAAVVKLAAAVGPRPKRALAARRLLGEEDARLL